MKGLKIKRIAIALTAQLLFFISWGQQILVSNWELPDVNIPVSTSYLGYQAGSFQWSSNCADVKFASASSSVTTFSISRTSSCNYLYPNSIQIRFDYSATTGTPAVYQSQPQLSRGIRILPYLEADDANLNVTSNIFPGETVVVTAKTLINGTTPIPCAANNTWTVSGGATHTQYQSNQWREAVTCNQSGFGNNILVNMTVHCIPNPKSLTQLSLSVKLRNPTFASAPTSIGCGTSPGNVVFSVNQPTGATHYVWTYPTSLLSPVGSVNGPSITFDAISIGSGSVSVQAFASSGSPVKSAVLVSPQFSICCTDVPLNLNDVVDSSNSPYLKESVSQINSSNDITATGAATIHAADEVRLLPGFNAVAGSEVHIYNDGCTSTYYRVASNVDTSNIELIHKIQVADFADADMKMPAVTVPEQFNNPDDTGSSAEKKITESDTGHNQPPGVIPNPSSGQFTIQFHTMSEKPARLIVLDSTGKTVYEVLYTSSDHYLLDLSAYPDGIYALRIEYPGQHVKKLLVKSGNTAY